MNASSLCRSVALVKPHQALEAYVSLAITTLFNILSVYRYLPCHEHAVFLSIQSLGTWTLLLVRALRLTDCYKCHSLARTFMVVTLTRKSCHYDSVVILFHAWFLPRDAMHKRSLCRHAVSVCVFVTFVDHVNANKDIFKLFSLSGNHTILGFPCQTA